jgi:type IV pilus assembly protein PilA
MQKALRQTTILFITLLSLGLLAISCSGNKTASESQESVTASLPDLDNKADDALRAEGKTSLGSFHRAQQAQYLIDGKFASTFDELDLSIPAETERYTFTLVETTETQTIATATAKQADLKSYISVVFVADDQQTVAILCGSDQPTQTPPSPPQFEGTTATCAPGSTAVE